MRTIVVKRMLIALPIARPVKVQKPTAAQKGESMKKLFAIAITLLMLFGTTTLVACDDTFNGNYKEASANETQNFIEKVAENNQEEDALADAMLGMELSANVTVKGKDENGNEKSGKLLADVKTTVENGTELKLSAKAEISGDSELPAGKLEAYASDGKLYVNSTIKGLEMKGYVEIPLDTVKGVLNVNTLGSVAGSSLDMGDALSEIDADAIAELQGKYGENAIKFYLDESANKLRVDIDIKDAEDFTGSLKGSVYFAFDKDYKFTGIKIDVDYVVGDMQTDINVVVKAYTGKVDVPTDFSDYGTLEFPGVLSIFGELN